MKKKYLLLLLLLALVTSGKVKAQYTVTDVFPSITVPYITEAVPAVDGSNKMFIISQKGIVYIANLDQPTQPLKTFLSITDRVSPSSAGAEVGLLSFCFHPNYLTNGYFYVSYTNTPSGGSLTSYICRYSVSPTNPDSAIKNSESVILTLVQPYSNHNGGKIAFRASDGFLYIGFGDGGSEGDPLSNGQNKTVLFSKILRIDPNTPSGSLNYTIPPSNPYYDSTNGMRKETWAWGVRNPWKFSFDATTDRLWLGDVGQNTREEVDIVEKGGNYGWKTMEGFLCYSPSSGCDTNGLKKPVIDFTRTDCGSITGGYVVRNSASLPELNGKYLMGDYVTKKIIAVTYTGITPATATVLLTAPASTTCWAVDKNNNHYACSYGSAGKLYKLTDTRVAVGNYTSTTPDKYDLVQNYPNPFNPSTKITFSLPQSGNASLVVYDNMGRIIETLVNNENFNSGFYTREFNAVNLSSGVYYYKLTAGNFSETKKMLLVK